MYLSDNRNAKYTYLYETVKYYGTCLENKYEDIFNRFEVIYTVDLLIGRCRCSYYLQYALDQIYQILCIPCFSMSPHLHFSLRIKSLHYHRRSTIRHIR